MTPGFIRECEEAALHRSGAIQSHGALLVLDDSGRITHVSANVEAWLGTSPEGWIGALLPDRLELLVSAVPLVAGARMTWVGIYEGPAGDLDLVANRGENETLVLEFTLHLEPEHEVRALPDASASVEMVASAENLQALCESIADITDFQRVMYYRFTPNGDGEVVAEALRGEAYGSYLQHRFPASDIPNIARQLYMKNPWRLIPDAQAEPIAVLGQNTVPDLTWSDLRSVSPIHCEYLANMGVRASLSFPVVVNKELAALIACHHDGVRALPLNYLEAASACVQAHSMSLVSWSAHKRMHFMDGLEYTFAPVRAMLQRCGSLDAAWPELGPWLMQAFQCQGAVYSHASVKHEWGQVFEPPALAVLEKHLDEQPEVGAWMSEHLLADVPLYPHSIVAGVISLHTRRNGQSVFLHLTRTEEIQHIVWGGNPEKPNDRMVGTHGISPRRSFERWVEKRLGYSHAWKNEDRLLAFRLREFLINDFYV